MAIFRSASKKAEPEYVPHREVSDKVDSNIHDPILTAVNEAQPFEEANQSRYAERRPSYLSQESGDLKDIFGQPIVNPDMLNPTRSRNERPLDTIRAFEYAITGDNTYHDQLETRRLGWNFHEDFSYHNMNRNNDAVAGAEYSRPVASFSGADQPIYQAPNYSASSLNPEKKKKRGLFGRKKN